MHYILRVRFLRAYFSGRAIQSTSWNLQKRVVSLPCCTDVNKFSQRSQLEDELLKPQHPQQSPTRVTHEEPACPGPISSRMLSILCFLFQLWQMAYKGQTAPWVNGNEEWSGDLLGREDFVFLPTSLIQGKLVPMQNIFRGFWWYVNRVVFFFFPPECSFCILLSLSCSDCWKLHHALRKWSVSPWSPAGG